MNVLLVGASRSMAGEPVTGTIFLRHGHSYYADGRPLHLILSNWIVADACQINRKIISRAYHLLKTKIIDV